MKRYRLVEATSLSGYGMLREEPAIGAVKKALAPIENRTFKLDWDKIEDRLGGPVPYDVRERVERVCGGTTFKGAKLIKYIGLASLLMSGFLYSLSIWFRSLNNSATFNLLYLVTPIIGIINILSYVILRSIVKKKLSQTGIEDCIKSAKNGELKSDLVWQALHYSRLGKKENMARDLCYCCDCMALAAFIGLDTNE